MKLIIKSNKRRLDGVAVLPAIVVENRTYNNGEIKETEITFGFWHTAYEVTIERRTEYKTVNA